MTIVLHKFNPHWSSIYSEEKEKISLILGELLLHIEHIGSTSVEQLSAKPIIDMAAGVMSLEEARYYKEAFAGIGYEMVDHEEFPYRVFFRKGSFGAGTCHLHICEYQNDYWNNLITFRNILRKDRKIRTEYESLKISLAGKYQDDRQKYTEGKQAFILRTLAHA